MVKHNSDKHTIIVGGEFPVCGLCGTPYYPSDHDHELGICECGRMIDLASWITDLEE